MAQLSSAAHSSSSCRLVLIVFSADSTKKLTSSGHTDSRITLRMPSGWSRITAWARNEPYDPP